MIKCSLTKRISFAVAFTTAIFFCTTLLVGKKMFGTMMPRELMLKLIKALVHTGILHFLLIPMYICIAIVTKISISSLI